MKYGLRNMVYCFSAGLLFMLLNACTPETMTVDELEQYVLNPDNGLIKGKDMPKTKVKVAYKPTDLLVAKELGDYNVSDSCKIEELHIQFNNYSYFILSISFNEKDILSSMQTRGDFSNMLNLFAFNMADYVFLTNSKGDTMPVADYVYPRMYGSSVSTSMMFAFNNENIKGSEWVKFYIDDIGIHTGNLEFTFNLDDIDRIPRVDFEKVINI